MPKKIKKRSKKKDDEEVVEPEAELVKEPEVPEEVETFGDLVVDIPQQERDAFQEASFKAASWIEENRPAAMGIFFVVLLLPFGIYAAFYYQGQQEVEASVDVSQAIQMYQHPIEGSREMELIEQNERIKKPETVYESREAKWQAIYDKAAAAATNHGEGPLSVSARYAKAGAAYHLGKYDEAAALYKELLAEERAEDLHVFARFGLAMAQAGQGDVASAAVAFDELAGMNEEYVGLALYHKGRVYEAAGKAAEAKEAYHKLLEEQPKTTYKSDVERRLALL